MGIRYEKDTILNWINEMGKFLRLLVDKYDAFEPVDQAVIEDGYRSFFDKERSWILSLSEGQLQAYVDEELIPDQIRPLALLLLHDARHSKDRAEQLTMLQHSKFLLNHVSIKLGSFSFEDYGNLAAIDKMLQDH